MATYEVDASVASATYINGSLAVASAFISKITDDDSNSMTLEINEEIQIFFGKTGFKGFFRGTISVNGKDYPVVELSGTAAHYVIGFPNPGGTSNPLPSTIGASIDTGGPFTVCFFPGTLIATPSGERTVEELVSGDPVLIGDSGAIPATWFGRKFACAVSVKWIGRQTVSTLFGPAERLMPIRFAAGSLGGGGNPFNRIAI